MVARRFHLLQPEGRAAEAWPRAAAGGKSSRAAAGGKSSRADRILDLAGVQAKDKGLADKQARLREGS